MARKEINIFGTSFLDLLSGALGAVIILFIIVPKMTNTEHDIVQKLKELEDITGNIEDILSKLENSVPKETLKLIATELNDLRHQTEVMQKELAELKKDVKAVQDENEQLRKQVEGKDRELEKLRKQVASVTEELEDANRRNSTANTIEKTLGVFAKFGILCRWEETDADVDIGVQKFGGTPGHCWRMYPSKPWGILGEDVRERDFDEDERFELYYVPKIVPDLYTAWVNIYEGSRGKHANVYATLIFHPGKPDERRHEIGPIDLYGSGHKCFVTFRLSDNGFEILPHREPIWGDGRVIK